ncbi:MAG TPA: hypothetical protein PK102_00380, partial [bacterium]|nr:hypothetical protein [bacterium]
MKILNIVDVNIVKIVLTKYYIAKNLEYDFIYPELEAVKKRISEYKPDILVVQSNLMYTDVAGFLNMLNMDIDSDVIVFMIREDADQQEELSVSLAKYRSVHFAGKENFYELFDSLLPSELTKKFIEIL